jgi:hypothetical protein
MLIKPGTFLQVRYGKRRSYYAATRTKVTCHRPEDRHGHSRQKRPGRSNRFCNSMRKVSKRALHRAILLCSKAKRTTYKRHGLGVQLQQLPLPLDSASPLPPPHTSPSPGANSATHAWRWIAPRSSLRPCRQVHRSQSPPRARCRARPVHLAPHQHHSGRVILESKKPHAGRTTGHEISRETALPPSLACGSSGYRPELRGHEVFFPLRAATTGNLKLPLLPLPRRKLMQVSHEGHDIATCIEMGPLRNTTLSARMRNTPGMVPA